MTVIKDIPLNLEMEEILRREGISGKRRTRPEIKNTILELLAALEHDRLIEPAMSYEIFSGEEIDRRQLSLKGSGDMRGRLLTSVIPEAREIAVAVCTIGPGLETRVTGYSKSGDILRGMLLDGIGTTAVDSLCREVYITIAKEVGPRGYQVGSPINPGMPCLPVTEQSWILDLAHSKDIGVTLSSSGMMVPRKSTSMVIGIGHEMQTRTQSEVCDSCNLRETCHYKYVHA